MQIPFFGLQFSTFAIKCTSTSQIVMHGSGNMTQAMLLQKLNMIEVSGGIQSLYTSRPWGLKPLI